MPKPIFRFRFQHRVALALLTHHSIQTVKGMSLGCLKGDWKVSVRCLEGVLRLSGSCLESVWLVFGSGGCTGDV